MAKCKSCGAEIVWIKTANNKRMPCDAAQVGYWEKEKAKGKVVTPNGEIKSCEFIGEAGKMTGMGYSPHWSTCPKAENHRRHT